MEELARKAAEALDALGSCSEGRWDDRKAALLREGKRAGVGFNEVLSWFDIDTE